MLLSPLNYLPPAKMPSPLKIPSPFSNPTNVPGISSGSFDYRCGAAWMVSGGGALPHVQAFCPGLASTCDYTQAAYADQIRQQMVHASPLWSGFDYWAVSGSSGDRLTQRLRAVHQLFGVNDSTAATARLVARRPCW